MHDVFTVKKYGIPNGKIIGSFGLGNVEDVLMEVFESKEIIIKGAETHKMITFPEFGHYHVTGNISLCENGLMIKFQEHNDPTSKHEDAGRSELYVMNDEIVYIITEIDKRINNEYKINTEISQTYQDKMGKKIVIPEEVKEAANFGEKINFFFSKGKRKKQMAQRNLYLSKIESAIDKLVFTDIEIVE